jgi:flagellar biosynthesis protein
LNGFESMTDKSKKSKAVALSYKKESGGAPIVVAGGKGAVADKILALADEAGVEVVKDPDLVELLDKVPVGREIPTELYQAVAEILAFVYRVNKRMD